VWHEDSEVVCNGEAVFKVSGTKEKYVVDVWSGNHPFYLSGEGGAMILDDEQVNKFKNKYKGLDFGITEQKDAKADAAGSDK